MSSPNPSEGTATDPDSASLKGGDPPVQDRIAEPSVDEKQAVVEKKSEQKPAYSVLSRREKWTIVAITGFAAMFSTFTANIYLPAIPTLTTVFHKSTEDINLTVTVYMIVQGIAPMFWGTLSDLWGRRPMLMGCMIVLAGACVGLALIPTEDYWLLMVLRCLQALGSASTVALGAGAVADVAAPHERGSFLGLWSMGPMLGPCIGPVLGGILAQGLSWRAIFWFLVIASAVCCLLILLFLPETLRIMVGNQSIQPPPFYRPTWPLFNHDHITPDYSTRPSRNKFVNPFKLFLYPDITILLVYNGVLYGVFYGITASISTIFKQTYSYLNEITIGLCFLAIGGGMLVGAILNGKLQDRQYRAIKERMIRIAEADPEKKIRPEDVTKEENFPIEEARLGYVPYYVVIYVACTIGYGWALDKGITIAVPLILSFFIGMTVTFAMNTAQNLIIDLAPFSSSSVTACNNLVRCSLGAVMVSVINIILQNLGTGWTYVLLAGICAVLSPLMWINLKYGPYFRAQRRARRLAEEANAKA